MQDAPIESAAEATPPRTLRCLAGRCGAVALRLCIAAAIVVCALVFALFVVLSRGPVETEAAARRAESVLAELGGPGAIARVGTTVVDWSWSSGITLSLADVAVVRPAALNLEVPKLVVRLRVLPLLVGNVRPWGVEIDGPHLSLDSAELQGMGAAASAADASTAAPTAPAPVAALAVSAAGAPVSTRLAEALDGALDRALTLARDEGFRTVALRGGELDLTHPTASGGSRKIELHDVEIDAVIDGPGGELDAGVSARGEVGRWNMRLTRSARDDGGHRLAFSAEDVTFADLFGPSGPTFTLGMPFYPSMTLGYGADGRFDGAALDLRLGAGVLRFGAMPEDEILFDEVTARAAWSPRDRVFAVEQVSASIGETRWNLHGRIAPPPGGTGVWNWNLVVDEGSLKPRDVPGPAMAIRGGKAEGTFDPATSFLDATLAEASFGDAVLHSAGRLDLSGSEPHLIWDLRFSPLSTSEVVHAWPHWVAPDARAWFVRSVSAGRLTDVRIRLDMPRFDHQETWPGKAVQMDGRFDGIRFVALGNLPPVVAAEGRVSVVDRRFEAVVDKARAATRGREPAIDGLRFVVADIFQKPPRGSIRLHATGDTASLAEIADAEPLALLSQAGMPATGFSGTGNVTAQVDVVFQPVMDSKSIDYRIEAALDGFASQQPIDGRRLQDAKFRIVIDPRSLDVTGRAVVDGVATDIHVVDSRNGAKGGEKRDFKLEIDDAARQRMGIDLGGILEGAVGVGMSQPDPAQNRSHIEADLGPAKITLAVFGWTKGPGVPAKAVFDTWEDDKGIHFDNVAVDSEGLTIRGSLLVDRDHNLVSADFPRFGLRKGDSAKVKVGRAADKSLVVTFDAASFDARGLLNYSRRSTPADAAAGPDLVLKLRGASVLGFNDISLSDLSVDARMRGGAFQSLDLKTRVGTAKKQLSVVVKPEAQHRRFTVSSEDAGAVLSFLDLFDRIQGGTLVLSARLDAPGTSDGNLRLADFHLLEEPKAGRVAGASQDVDGIRRVQIRKAEIDRSTNFDRAQIRFTMHDGVIDVTQGVAKGASVGATATGQIDVAGQRLSLSGTYIPAFGLNNLAGRIPIFGTITGSGSNEGLVGVTFRVVGPIEDPILQINPLSAVAPGIFRRIFEFQNDDMGQSSGDPSAPTRITPDAGPAKITP